MKRILTAAGLLAISFLPAAAADLPVKAPMAVPVMAPAFSWTGFYIGANGGYAFGGRDEVDIAETQNGAAFVSGTWPGFANFGRLEPKGWFGGGQIGYNWQVTNIVLGLEADFQGASIKSSQSATLPYIVAPNTINVAAGSNIDWFGTVRGRLGWAFDRWMIYATGGFAYAQNTYTVAMTDTFGFVANINSKTTRPGYVVGGGVEWSFAPSWSVKAEYQYINLGTYSLAATETTAAGASAFAIATQARPDFHTLRLGINYLFNAGGPVVARY
jgi:outer membrane immunogenic protein